MVRPAGYKTSVIVFIEGYLRSLAVNRAALTVGTGGFRVDLTRIGLSKDSPSQGLEYVFTTMNRHQENAPRACTRLLARLWPWGRTQ